MDTQQLSQRLSSLVVFRDLRKDPVMASMEAMLKEPDQAELVAEFCATLFEKTTDWSKYLLKIVVESENMCIRSAAKKGMDSVLATCLDQELAFLQTLSQVTLSDVTGLAFLPAWKTQTLDFAGQYALRMEQVGQKGYGLFAKYHVFTVEGTTLVPVRHPDGQALSQLTGYEREQAKIVANTEALLEGRPCNNVLLYGDAGTGKSSAVKAIANLYADRGLRLVEVKKNQLYQIPSIVEELASNPLKFILFIDDLSFTANDDNFAALKAILEGSVSGKSDNLAVYATSNRRHLVKECMSDRTGDDIHESDTRQELMSLAARFGLTITFLQPDKDKYESIVLALAEEYGVEVDDMLLIHAKAFAQRSGGRSPRAAKQFIQLRKAGVV
ncbi:ATP-binding protein [Bengtsoniella intestinalis]|uniref:ATP-binding protein n=1 Tax=Bengtsoniella intestinalis TaxID=3073143 RepID=UPI00391EEDF8